MIAAVSPSTNDYEETLSTLKYADRAKRVRMRVEANVVTSSGNQQNDDVQLVPALQAEVKKLKEMLALQEAYRDRQQLPSNVPMSEQHQVATHAVVQEMQQRVRELEVQLEEREKFIQTLVNARSSLITTGGALSGGRGSGRLNFSVSGVTDGDGDMEECQNVSVWVADTESSSPNPCHDMTFSFNLFLTATHSAVYAVHNTR